MSVLRKSSPEISYYIVNGFARTAVPFFFVTTGFYLARRDELGYLPLIKRVAGLYVVWSLLYAPLWLNSGPGLFEISKNILFGYSHLWYLISLAEALVLFALIEKMPTSSQMAIVLPLYLIGFVIEIWSFFQ